MFPSETYIERRKALRNQVGDGVILFLGNEESSINYADNWYPFRQDSSFLYYFGIALPELLATIDCESGEEIIYGNNPTIDDIVWTGPQPTLAELAGLKGIHHTQAISSLERVLKGALALGRIVHILPPYRDRHLVRISEFTGWPIREIRSRVSVPLIQAIIAQRKIKTAEEIGEIEKAVDITGEMHLTAMKMTRPGLKEYEILGHVYETVTRNAGYLAFPVILTKDGQTLHNHYHGNAVKTGDLILCDAGAETSSGYCGDMTRTFPVSGAFTTRQAEVYQTVLDAHESAVNLLRPGVSFRDVHLEACKKLFEGLKSIGLTKGNADEAVAEGAHTLFFQCGLGHMMGLDVHDMENLGEEHVGYTPNMKKSTEFGLKSLRLGRTLEAGFVLTVEPGIYLIPQLIDRWASEKKHIEFINYDVVSKFRDFGGIRIEENFAITESSSRLLGLPIPKTIQEIEAIRQLA